MPGIKICGLTRPEDIRTVNRFLPDFIGFVFAPSRRQIEADTASMLKSGLDPSIRSVGVFVNEDISRMEELCRRGIIDLIQLHGDEDECYIQSLRSVTDLPIIKAVRVSVREDIIKASQLSADFLLLDTYVKGICGGSGKQFGWDLIPPLRQPWFLAGGLNLQNLPRALKLPAYCLDLSSSLETDGKKDEEKIRSVMELIRKHTESVRRSSAFGW